MFDAKRFAIALPFWILLGLHALVAPRDAFAADATAEKSPANLRRFILTPAPPATPRVNGPRIYGQRPKHPFLYTVPATGGRPLTFSAEGLPPGLTLDPATGQISGAVESPGEHIVAIKATNARGSNSKPLKIVIGETIALTPPMGWNSWNCWAKAVDQDKVLRAARAMSESGLVNYGWSYINIDDA